MGMNTKFHCTINATNHYSHKVKKKKEEGNVSVELWRMGLYFVLTQKFWMFPIQINGDRYT